MKGATLVCLVACLGLSCCRDSSQTHSLSPHLQAHLRVCKSFSDLFSLSHSVAFESSDSVILQSPRAIRVAGDDKLFWAQYEPPIYVFDQSGRCLRVMGNKGRGPGEFNSVVDLGVDGKGRLFIFDSALLRVSLFDNQLQYTSSFLLRAGGLKRICLDRSGNVYTLHEGAYGATKPAITQYNDRGDVVAAWGEIPGSAAAQDVLIGGGIAVDEEGSIYHGYISDYRIWKRSQDGDERVFDEMPRYFRHINETIARADTRVLVREAWKASRMMGIFILSSGLVIQQIANGDPWAQEEVTLYIEVWDGEGVKWLSAIPCPGRIITAFGDSIGVLDEDYTGLSRNSVPTYTLSIYTLRTGAQGVM
jgi:hypothetical protein